MSNLLLTQQRLSLTAVSQGNMTKNEINFCQIDFNANM